MSESAVVVVPARMGSVRFPGKVLAPIAGTPMVLRVVRRALDAKRVSRVIVATDSPEVRLVVTQAGVECIMTSPELRCGSDRAAEVTKNLESELVVVLQGDQPTISASQIESAIEAMHRSRDFDMATLAVEIRRHEDIDDPAKVKVVADNDGAALYFSRAAIPFGHRSAGLPLRKHIGIYVYRRAALLRFAALPAHPLELAEQLEQLRALGNGMRILVVATDSDAIAVDHPSDIALAEEYFTRNQQS